MPSEATGIQCSAGATSSAVRFRCRWRGHRADHRWLSAVFTPTESALIRRLLAARATAGVAGTIDVADWLDPACDDLTVRLAVLPGLMARGVVMVTQADGSSKIRLSIPPDFDDGGGSPGDLNRAQRPAGSKQRQPRHRSGGPSRRRGARPRGRWLLRSDPLLPEPDPGRDKRSRRVGEAIEAPSNAPNPSDPAGFHAYATSWRGGSSDQTAGRLLDLVDVDEGIIAGSAAVRAYRRTFRCGTRDPTGR